MCSSDQPMRALESRDRSTALTDPSFPGGPAGTSQAHETVRPSRTVAAALLRTSGVTRLSVPSASSGPHRPQLERLSNQEITSCSEGALGMTGSLPMSEISERYQRLGDTFAAKIEAVPDDRWESQTPCEEWTARDLVGHVVSTQGMFLGFIGKELKDVPAAEAEPLAAWNAARAQVQAILDNPEQAQTEFQGFSGKSTFEAAADKFLCTDLVVHGWDLARATGLDERIEPEDVKRARRNMESMGDGLRSPGAFGAEVEAPSGADEQQKMLAFLGRKP